MLRYFARMTGIFISTTVMFSTQIRAEVKLLEENYKPKFAAESDYSVELTRDSIAPNAPLLAARDSSNAVDRAFGKLDKKRQKQQKYKYWYLLPFGIPQYTEGYRIMGSVLAVSQVTSLALYYDRLKKVDSGNKAASDVTKNVTPAQAAANPFMINFLNQNEKNVRDAQKEAKYSLYAFLGIYGFSIYEALYDPFDFRKVDALRSKKRSRDRDRDKDRESDRDRDRDDDNRDRDRDSSDDEEAFMDRSSRGRRSSFGFMFVPMEDRKYEVAISWQATLP